MTESIENQNKGQFLFILIIVLFGLRVASYFTLFPDSLALTQLVKTVGRIALTFTFVIIHYNLNLKIKEENKLKLQTFTATGLYLMYLLLGTLSLIWTSSVAFSSLQLSMIVEAFVFSWFFCKTVLSYNLVYPKELRYSYIFAVSTFYIGIAFLVGLYFDPEKFFRQTHGGEVSRLGGFIINPNELGMLGACAVATIYVEIMQNKMKLFHVLALLISISVILLTQSRSTLFALLLITLIVIIYSKKWYLYVSTAIGSIIVLPILVNNIILKQGDLDEVMSMTGRLPFWQDLIAFGFQEKPILGFGFMRISYQDKFDSIHAYAASMTHNTFIQVLLNLGLVGATIVFLQMIATFYFVSICKNIYYKMLFWMMYIPLFINSLTEFGIFGESNFGIQFYQILLVFLSFSGFTSLQLNQSKPALSTISEP